MTNLQKIAYLDILFAEESLKWAKEYIQFIKAPVPHSK